MAGTAPLTDTQIHTQSTDDHRSPDTQDDRRPACQWGTIRDAMEVLDVSEATIHRRAKRPEGRKGKLYKERNDDGGVLIGIPCEEDAGGRHATVGASHLTGSTGEGDFHVTVDDAQVAVTDAHGTVDDTQVTGSDRQGDSHQHALGTHLPVISMYWEREQQLLDRIGFLEQQARDFMALQQQQATTIGKQNDAALELQSELRALHGAAESASATVHDDAHASVTIRGSRPRGWFGRLFGK
jgi:hypothetical protein